MGGGGVGPAGWGRGTSGAGLRSSGWAEVRAPRPFGQVGGSGGPTRSGGRRRQAHDLQTPTREVFAPAAPGHAPAQTDASHAAPGSRSRLLRATRQTCGTAPGPQSGVWRPGPALGGPRLASEGRGRVCGLGVGGPRVRSGEELGPLGPSLGVHGGGGRRWRWLWSWDGLSALCAPTSRAWAAQSAGSSDAWTLPRREQPPAPGPCPHHRRGGSFQEVLPPIISHLGSPRGWHPSLWTPTSWAT